MKKRLICFLSVALVLCLSVSFTVSWVNTKRENEKKAQAATQIEAACKAVLALKFSNEPAFAQTQAQFNDAKSLLSTVQIEDEAILAKLQSAEDHLAGLTENPAFNYDRAELERIIRDQLEGKYGNWSVYLEFPGTDFQIEINNRAVIAASTIKLYNLIAFYNELNEGNLEMTDALEAQIHSMITVSSNSDSNAVTAAIGDGNFFTGAKTVTELAHTLGATDTQEEHMLFDVKTITPGRNTTSVRDCATVLRKLYLGECVSPEYDAQMLDILKQQTRRFKMPLYLPKNTVIAHKTGENNSVEMDVGIVYSPNCDYILCVSVTDFNGAPVRETFGRLSEKIYNYFNE